LGRVRQDERTLRDCEAEVCRAGCMIQAERLALDARLAGLKGRVCQVVPPSVVRTMVVPWAR
jgi:hypothetical protein